MKPDGYRGKGQRQSLHLPNTSVLLCLTVFSTKGSFNVQALDLSQEFKGFSLCFSLCCDLMFSLHKGKTVTFSFILSSCSVAPCVFCLYFFFSKTGGEKKKKKERHLNWWWNTFHWEDFERSCTSDFGAVLEACSVLVHVLFPICCLFFFPLCF